MHSKINQFLGIGLLFSMLALTANHSPEKKLNRSIDLQGHRGARGEFPEHTREGFQSAIEAGVQTLEFDLHYTKDQKFVLFHDHKISSENAKWGKDSNVDGKFIYELTSKDIESLDIGSIRRAKFPSQQIVDPERPLFLDEWLGILAEKTDKSPIFESVRFNMEIKIAPHSPNLKTLDTMLEDLLQILKKHEVLNRTCIQTFHLPILPIIHQKNQTIKTAALFSTTRRQAFFMKLGFDGQKAKILEETLRVNASIISPHYVYCDTDFVKKCHENGLKVIPWTVNKESLVRELVKQGVDGIITDYPHRIAPVLKKKPQSI